MLNNLFIMTGAFTLLIQLWYLIKAQSSKVERYWFAFFGFSIAILISLGICSKFIMNEQDYVTVGVGVTGIVTSLAFSLLFIISFLISLLGGFMRFSMKTRMGLKKCNKKENFKVFVKTLILVNLALAGSLLIQQEAILHSDLNVAGKAEKEVAKYLKSTYGKKNYAINFLEERQSLNESNELETFGYRAVVEIYEPYYRNCSVYIDGKTVEELIITRDDCASEW